VFPQAVGLGATWAPELLAEVGEAVAREVRAQRDAEAGAKRASLVVWAPVVNLLRDPRWGRNEEGYSEDQLLTSELATAFCRGLVGDALPHMRVAPILKHFYAYNQEDGRTRASMNVRPRVLYEYELPAFTGPLASGHAAGVMPSYNLVNGRPAHLAPEINSELRPVAPGELLVCSDAWAPSNIVDEQRYAPDHPTAHAWALRAGVDSFTDKDSAPAFTVGNLRAALQEGLITAADVDRAARRVLLARLRTGELDPDGGPFARDGKGRLCSREHALLARRTAVRSAVLLKNERSVLPLALVPGQRLALVGPLADSLFHDWYSGTMPYKQTLAKGLREAASAVGASVDVDEALDRVELRFASDGLVAGVFDACEWGYGAWTFRDPHNGLYLSGKQDGSLVADQEEPNGWVCREIFEREEGPEGYVFLRHRGSGLWLGRASGGGPVCLVERARAEALCWEVQSAGIERAASFAEGAAAAILAVGNHPLINGRETEDRPGLDLPAAAERLASAVLSACPRVVLLVMSSYPYALGQATSSVPAILWTSHAGQEAGNALAAVLTGAEEPGGRLAQTWYRSASDLPQIGDYDIIKSRRTYQYFEGRPLFCFGHGLGYTSFSYGRLEVEPLELREGGVAKVRVELTNTGRRRGAEVARSPGERPRHERCGRW
jgi:beta-glucosidase